MRRVTARAFPKNNLVEDARDLASFIRAARTQSDLTLEQAAMAVGVAKSTLQKLETDPTTVSLGIALQVARELGVSLFAVPSEQREILRKLIARLPNDALPGAPRT